jgi:hypothetical protein
MDFNRATLIQNIEVYLSILNQNLKGLEDQFLYQGYNKDDILKWIISEEIELIHGVTVKGHIQNTLPFAHLHNCLSGIMVTPLSILTNVYIRLPRLYGDLVYVEIEINGIDLYIRYNTSSLFNKSLQSFLKN